MKRSRTWQNPIFCNKTRSNVSKYGQFKIENQQYMFVLDLHGLMDVEEAKKLHIVIRNSLQFEICKSHSRKRESMNILFDITKELRRLNTKHATLLYKFSLSAPNIQFSPVYKEVFSTEKLTWCKMHWDKTTRLIMRWIHKEDIVGLLHKYKNMYLIQRWTGINNKQHDFENKYQSVNSDCCIGINKLYASCIFIIIPKDMECLKKINRKLLD